MLVLPQRVRIAVGVLSSLVYFAFSFSIANAGDVMFEVPKPLSGWTDGGFWGRGTFTASDGVAIRYRPTTVGQNVCTVKHGVYKYNNPTDSIILRVYQGGSAPASGALQRTVIIPAQQLGGSETLYTEFKLSPCLTLTADTNYFFVFSRSLLNSTTGYISRFATQNVSAQAGYWSNDRFNFPNWTEYPNREFQFRLEGADEPIKVPVLIIPGIAGSELKVGDDLIWLNMARMFTDINDQFLSENMALSSDGNSIQNINVGKAIESVNDEIITGLPILDTFSSLKSTLNLDGYISDQTLFYFPYDWRLNLTSTAQLLKDKIDQIKTQTGQNKVDIVAHSMGGLLTKEYIEQFGKNNIDKLIFVGTPHIGAPKAAKILLEGDNMGIPWLEEDRIKEVAENSVAVHELLPDQKYFDTAGQYIKESGNLLDYDQIKNLLINNGSSPNVFNSADNFFAENLENIDFAGIDTYNIAGCKNATQGGYEVRPDGSIAFIKYRTGDQTVPLVSSDYVSIPVDHKFYSTDGKHAELPSRLGTRNLIAGILSGKASPSYENISNDSSICGIDGKELIWRSPVEVHIYDVQNRHTGPIDGGIEYGIPGVDYEIFGHEKFIFIPSDGDYRVEAHGLDNGTFDLSVRQNHDGLVTGAEIFNDIPVTPSSDIQFNVSGLATIDTINLDENGDGSFFSVLATSHLDGSQADDIVPPEINIISPASPSYERSLTLPINIQAVDDKSGIFSVQSKFDGIDMASSSIDLFFYTLGSHSFDFAVTDNAGNTATKGFDFQVIATPGSTIFDIERAYILGWIGKKNIKNDLVQKIKTAIRIEKQIEYLEEKLPGKPQIIKKIEKLTKRLDKLLATQFLKQLDREYNKGNINKQAYDLLKEDIEWLLR